MSDTSLNQFVASGTAAEMAMFTPNPPTVAAAPDNGYFWYQTDTGNTYSWDGADWQIVGGSATGDVVGPGSAVDGNLAVFDGTSGRLIKDGGPPSGGGATVTAVSKPADTARNTTTTLTDDPDLTFAVGINEIWHVTMLLLWTAANGTMDYKLQFTVPSGAQFYWAVDRGAGGFSSSWSPEGGGGNPVVLENASTVGAGGSGTANPFGLRIEGVYIGGANAGNFTLQWAQNVSDGGDLTLKKGSALVGTLTT